MNEEEARQLVKNIFEEQISEEIKKHLDSGIIFKYISDMEEQLQSYKSKEDKLREYVKSNWVIDEPIKFKNDILDILNEGGKE